MVVTTKAANTQLIRSSMQLKSPMLPNCGWNAGANADASRQTIHLDNQLPESRRIGRG